MSKHRPEQIDLDDSDVRVDSYRALYEIFMRLEHYLSVSHKDHAIPYGNDCDVCLIYRFLRASLMLLRSDSKLDRVIEDFILRSEYVVSSTLVEGAAIKSIERDGSAE